MGTHCTFQLRTVSFSLLVILCGIPQLRVQRKTVSEWGTSLPSGHTGFNSDSFTIALPWHEAPEGWTPDQPHADEVDEDGERGVTLEKRGDEKIELVCYADQSIATVRYII